MVEDDLAFRVLLAEATGNDLQARLVRELRGLQHELNIVIAQMTDLEARSPSTRRSFARSSAATPKEPRPHPHHLRRTVTLARRDRGRAPHMMHPQRSG